ncbi:MAG: 4-hydroxythreonine-4-phosphate dehydrogenase PdxA [Planctomycetota bacterium]|nr:4-hydroxythreonine-4-phosphate dehydrogenase PdxA [Planctomycetota bacterium]
MDGPEESVPAGIVAVTAGDPAGIGPEILPAALAALEGRARLLAVGPANLAPAGMPIVASPAELPAAAGVAWLDSGAEGDVRAGRHRLGEVQASCGDAALRALRAAHDLAMAGEVAAVVTGPVNKAALHAAGARVEGQTELLSRWAGAERTEMIGFAGALRVMLATRHMPLREAIDRITEEHVLDRLCLLNEALSGLGFEAPRLALAGLNPHAGEGGLLGSEEGALLGPAVARARSMGIEVSGPVSPDTVFAEGARGLHDGILALYHDQAFIPLKLLGGGRGVTFVAGLPYLRFSPMHGTAFDIAGKRDVGGHPVADPGNLIEALEVACRALSRREAGGGPGGEQGR